MRSQQLSLADATHTDPVLEMQKCLLRLRREIHPPAIISHTSQCQSEGKHPTSRDLVHMPGDPMSTSIQVTCPTWTAFHVQV